MGGCIRCRSRHHLHQRADSLALPNASKAGEADRKRLTLRGVIQPPLILLVRGETLSRKAARAINAVFDEIQRKLVGKENRLQYLGFGEQWNQKPT